MGIACSKSAAVRSQAAYCGELVKRREALQPPPDAPLNTVYADAAEAFDALEPTSPAEIESDVRSTTGALHQLADLTRDAEGDPAEADDRKLVEVALAAKASTDRVNAYNRERCGVDTSAAISP